MRWLRRSSETPQLLGLSPLKNEDSLSVSTFSINSIDQHQQKPTVETISDILRNKTPNQSTRKSRIDQSNASSLSWSKKLTKSTENCYNIQEGRVVERGLKGRYISPVRIKNKNNSLIRSTSPDSQSITSIGAISTSTPTHQLPYSCNSQTLSRRILQREKLTANGFAADKNDSSDELENRLKNKLSRTIGGYSVPYREKRNPLSSTRLSCYKPISDRKFDISNLKNYKSVDDFLSLDHPDMNDSDCGIASSMPFVASSQDLSKNTLKKKNSCEETPKMNQQDSESIHKAKKLGIGNRFKSMSDKTHKLFSKIYSSSNLKSNSNSSSSDVCNDFIMQRPDKPTTNVINSRRSLSYGQLPGLKDFEAKKTEAEDGDSGILVNESGASSMVETDSSSDDAKTEIEPINSTRKLLNQNISSCAVIDRAEPKNETFDLSACRHSSSTDQILSPTMSFATRRSRNLSMDELSDRKSNEAPKRNSIVSELVAMIEKNETKFNTMRNPRRSKPMTVNDHETSPTSLCAISISNLCDDDKIRLKTNQSKENLCDKIERSTNFDDSTKINATSNFCTLPRRPKTNPQCSFLTVSFEKGPGKKSLGFTIVGGADSPRGALGIFIKSIMPNGQAVDSGLLRAGDEILAVNGQVCHDLTHQDAVRMFKSVKSGEIVLNICRRKISVK